MNEEYIALADPMTDYGVIAAPIVSKSEIGNAPVRWGKNKCGDYVLQWLDTDMVTWREVPFVRGV